jgi:hypothetical protein
LVTGDSASIARQHGKTSAIALRPALKIGAATAHRAHQDHIKRDGDSVLALLRLVRLRLVRDCDCARQADCRQGKPDKQALWPAVGARLTDTNSSNSNNKATAANCC